MLAELRAAGGEKPAELDAGDPRLVPWGYAEGGGHHLYWLVRPGVEPEEWTVVLNAGGGPLRERPTRPTGQVVRRDGRLARPVPHE
ncbi:hypothetical protein [Streptomyces sp. NBC_00728]|uniref:hypothetical protein n=1 Tax=Streptomyces sp. NBC_00728 TaxID=2903676 RepID=UPI00386B4AA0